MHGYKQVLSTFHVDIYIFNFLCSLNLTSAWLCMSVVLVVTIQWPMCTNMIFKLFNTYLFSLSYKFSNLAKGKKLGIIFENTT